MARRRIGWLTAVLAVALGGWWRAAMVPPTGPSLIEGAIPIDHPPGVPDGPDDEYVYWDN